MSSRTSLLFHILLVACGAPLAACSDDGASDVSDTAETSETSDAAETSDGETTTPLSPCDPAYGPVTPVGTDDVTYDHVTATDCLSEPCACSDVAAERVEKLLACDAIGLGWYEGLGSVYMRVVGRDDGHCVIDVGTEVEGGVGVSRCRLPLPLTAWAGLEGALGGGGTTEPLAGIEDRCEQILSCCVLTGCPQPCTGEEAVPLCPVGRVDYCAP
ncbi:MAG: hypothetical protein IT385_27720 [Deltaproteobacteria bacterium]|nr:hypothetical protein [Deltaproteobacteria bacterium]